MAPNHYVPHVLVIPEDDANRQIANGFWNDLALAHPRQLQVLANAGGWHDVRDSFLKYHVPSMRSNGNRYVILLLDFDESNLRRKEIAELVPIDLVDRVFILGSYSDADQLRTALAQTPEEIGAALASDCAHNGSLTWDHELLRNNSAELERLRMSVRNILF